MSSKRELCYNRIIKRFIEKLGDKMRLLIVENHEIVRKGLIMILQERFEAIEEASTLEEGINKCMIYEPEIVIVDVNLNGANGLILVEQAKEKELQTKFIIFTASGRHGDYEKAKELGVEGYILKDAPIDDIVYAVDSIKRGRLFYDTKLEIENLPNKREQVLVNLTEREREIFKEIGVGYSNLEIAERLYISENTVKKHITSLMGKLGVKRRTEVALYATQLWRRRDD